MSRMNEILSDDTNQFGPGTDLTISLLAVMLVIALITMHLYKAAAASAAAKDETIKWLEAFAKPEPPPKTEDHGGSFKPATEFFTAADFHSYPVVRLVDPAGTKARIRRIMEDYRRVQGEYPFIFVIGHSNRLDDPRVGDRSDDARRKRNLEYALRRSAMIAGLIQEHLHDDQELDRLVAVSTGEADLRDRDAPLSQENAWVEVMFGKEWKPAVRRPRE